MIMLCQAAGCEQAALQQHYSLMAKVWYPLCAAHAQGYLTLLMEWQKGDRKTPMTDVLERLEHVTT